MSQSIPATQSTPGAEMLPDGTAFITVGHLIWIAIFALAAIAVIVWGMRQTRARKASARELVDHNNTLDDQTKTQATAPQPATIAPTPPPLIEPDVVPLGPAPSPIPAPIDAGPADGPVTQLKGLGPKVAQRLAELGITTVGQIAAMTDDEAAALDAQLGAFGGRMERDRWLEQARFLAAGDRAGFESVFGRLS